MTTETAASALSRSTHDDPTIAVEQLPTEFGGYRIVRVLARSDRATTAVVHAGGTTRVARVFSTACPDATIDRELAIHDAIARADVTLRSHLAALDDLVTLPDGRMALILELVSGPSVADLLVMRHGQLALGEAVTILAPLADVLEGAHAVGLTSLSFIPSAVRFDAAGAPVVVGVADAAPGPVLPERFRALEPAYADDAAGFQRLGAAVAAAVVESDRSALTAALVALPGGRAVSAALFDLAAPLPVALHEHAAVLTSISAAPVLAPLKALETQPVTPGTRSTPQVTPAVPGWVIAGVDVFRVLGLPPSVIDPVQRVAERLAARVEVVGAAIAPVRERVRDVRRRVLVAGAAGVIALIAAIALVAGAGGGDRTDSASTPNSTSETSTSRPVDDTELPSSLPNSSPESAGGPLNPLAPESLLDPAADEWPEIIDELVGRWLECRAVLNRPDTGAEQTCAPEVVHVGSAAERLIGVDDARHETLAQWRERGGESVVVERMGGAAIIDLVPSSAPNSVASTTAASLLVVRSEAGWRVRDVFSGEPVD